MHISKSNPCIGGAHDNIFICACCEVKYCIEYKRLYSLRDEEVSGETGE